MAIRLYKPTSPGRRGMSTQDFGEIARRRRQSLAQMAVAWTLRGGRVTSSLIGASRPSQIVDLSGAMKRLDFSTAELAAIDQHAVDGGINLWRKPSTDQRPG